jgi:uncharacterized damage-inducible protein DinB
MAIADLLMPEFDMEIATTRRVLQRVPDERGEWKPHEKSFPMAHLAQLVSAMPSWMAMMMAQSEMDIAPKEGRQGGGYTIEKTEKLLADFDRNVAAAREAIGGATDEALNEPWTLKSGGRPIASGTRYLMIRTLLLNHLVHHRAQLGVYLRLVDVPVPSMYGPSADEKV